MATLERGIILVGMGPHIVVRATLGEYFVDTAALRETYVLLSVGVTLYVLGGEEHQIYG